MFEELCAKINDLDGIISCKITGDKEIDEIHIVANKKRHPKRIVRDIETMVQVIANHEINHKKISIAQINDLPVEQESNRIEIVSIYQEHNHPVCPITVKIDGELVEDKAMGSVEEPISFIVARGMIDIIENYTDINGKLRVENIFTTGFKEEILVVQLSMFNKGKQERFLGAVYIKQNLPLAVGKAVLKALNRII